MMPDWTTFNGYAGQYVAHPLTADPGDTVRFYVVDAGPSLTTAFHVVGTILDTAYVDGDMNPGARAQRRPDGRRPGRRRRGLRREDRRARGSTPSSATRSRSVDIGQVGLLKVGNPPGTMSH